MSDCAQPRQGAAYNETYHTHTPSIHTTHFYFHSVTIMSAMPGPIPGSHTASHEPSRVCTLTIHDVTHLPLCASTGGGLGAIPSFHFLPLPSTTSSMTPRVVQTQSFSTSANSTSPPREASHSGGDRLPSNFFFFSLRALRVHHLLFRATNADAVNRYAGTASSPPTSLGPLHAPPSYLNKLSP